MSPPPPSKNCARLRTTTQDYAQLSTIVDFIVLSIQLVFMVLGVSYSRVAAQLVFSVILLDTCVNQLVPYMLISDAIFISSSAEPPSTTRQIILSTSSCIAELVTELTGVTKYLNYDPVRLTQRS